MGGWERGWAIGRGVRFGPVDVRVGISMGVVRCKVGLRKTIRLWSNTAILMGMLGKGGYWTSR